MRNRIRCKKCGDIIESEYTHDFKFCSCKNIFVDGGHDYCRWGGNLEDIEPLTKEVLIDKYDVLKIRMSKTAKEKIEAMEGKQYITCDNEKTLPCLMLYAWRYCQSRHFTQAIKSFGIDTTIIKNMSIMPTYYLKQIVDDIDEEYRRWDLLDDEKRKATLNSSPHYLEGFKNKLQAEIDRRFQAEMDRRAKGDKG